MWFQFFQNILPALEPNAWRALTDPASAHYHPMWAPAILFEAVFTVLYFVFTLWLSYLFFLRKSARVPRLFIIWLALNIIFQIIDQILIASIPDVAGSSAPAIPAALIRSVTNAAIWIPYFARSNRVKNTFTNEIMSWSLVRNQQRFRVSAARQ